MRTRFMNIGILGSGMVGKTLAEGFSKKNHAVMIGSRTPAALKDFIKKTKKVRIGTLAEAATFGELIIICVKGMEWESAISLAGHENFTSKIVIDVTNPLIFKEENKPPRLGASYPESNGERMQELLLQAKVVKAFNTVPATYMCNPVLVEGVPDLFIAGNDPQAKQEVRKIAHEFGWKDVIDLGDIHESYLLEALAMIWIKYGFDNNIWTHAFKLLKK